MNSSRITDLSVNRSKRNEWPNARQSACYRIKSSLIACVRERFTGCLITACLQAQKNNVATINNKQNPKHICIRHTYVSQNARRRQATLFIRRRTRFRFLIAIVVLEPSDHLVVEYFPVDESSSTDNDLKHTLN